jgi:hypothetical protein
MRAYDDRWRALQQVIAERAAHPDMRDVPGGRTGLLVRSLKTIGSGDAAREVAEYRLDAAILKELRELERQAAEEAGQWTTRSEVNGAVAVGVSVLPDLPQLLRLPAEELLRLHAETLGPAGPGDGG